MFSLSFVCCFLASVVYFMYALGWPLGALFFLNILFSVLLPIYIYIYINGEIPHSFVGLLRLTI